MLTNPSGQKSKTWHLIHCGSIRPFPDRANQHTGANADAFNWTQREADATYSDGLSYIDTDIIEVIPPPPVQIEGVPEDELSDEAEDFVDPTIVGDDLVFIPEAKPKPAPAPAPDVETSLWNPWSAYRRK